MSTPSLDSADLDQHLDRRRLLQTAAGVTVAAGLSACQESPLRSAAGSATTGSAEADPDEALLQAAARDEALMVAWLEPLLATGPVAVRRTLQVHRAHLALLDLADQDDEASAGSRLRVGEIAAAEDRLARRHARAARQASSGQFARVLAAMAASAAQQAEVWRRGGGGG